MIVVVEVTAPVAATADGLSTTSVTVAVVVAVVTVVFVVDVERTHHEIP